jgi:ADP-ribose pyrophosphatase YjhB (NUDIX family)
MSSTGLSDKKIREKLLEDFGYVTSKLGANGLVFNERGEILLESRKDDGSWGLPGGWVDPTDTPEESCIRELKEETGLEVEIVKLLGVCSRKAGSFGVHHSSAHLIYLCKVVGGELKFSFESNDVSFWDIDKVPCWHRDHLLWIKKVYSNLK